MKITTATAITDDVGPLTKIVDAYTETHGRLAASGASTPEEWAPWAQFVDVALRLAPPGTHVAAPELVWRAAQGNAEACEAAVRAWLLGGA